MILLVAWLGLAVAQDDALLTPTLAGFDKSLARAERLLETSREVASRLADAQATWVTASCVDGRCPEALALELVLTARDAGHETRDQLQGTRAEVTRLGRMATATTVQPLLDPVRRQRLVAVTAGVEATARVWSVRVAWYARFMEPWADAHEALVESACVQRTPEATP